MRYPYTPSYNERYLETLSGKPGVSVITAGKSKEGRPLQIVKIGEGTEEDEKRKPCVLIYAREHADEQDSSWAAQGAVEFLISDSPEANRIRQGFTFLVIPILDPDGAARAIYENITDSFHAGLETSESTTYSALFKGWVDRGNPIHLVLNLHNVESKEAQQHVAMLTVEVKKVRQAHSRDFYNEVGKWAREVKTRQWPGVHEANGRLGIWLSEVYGALNLAFELNVQEQSRHLTLGDLRQIGKVLVFASGEYLSSETALSLVASIDENRTSREARWKKYAGIIPGKTAIEAERNCQWREQSDRLYAEWGGRPPL